LTLLEAVKRGIAATRQLAKRQLTWIRSDATLACIDPHACGAFDRWNQELGRELCRL
jgi:tRNA A37 N6-isopentenylltransferase MiaA